MGPEFYQTGLGRKFYEVDVPELVKQMARIAAALEEQNRLQKEQLKQATEKIAEN